MQKKESPAYQALCTEFYDLDKPEATYDALQCFLKYASEARGAILEPMCGTGRYLVPLLEKGYAVSGFDYSAHMLDRCRKKCREKGLTASLQEATFESFDQPGMFNLIFIPSGSFCHLTTNKQVDDALKMIVKRLNPGGKFVVDIEMLSAVREPQNTWHGRFVARPDGSKIVLNVLSQFDKATRIETGLFRYELWQANVIVRTEVEDYYVRHYDSQEIEAILARHNLKVIGKWQTEPYARIPANDSQGTIRYECVIPKHLQKLGI